MLLNIMQKLINKVRLKFITIMEINAHAVEKMTLDF